MVNRRKKIAIETTVCEANPAYLVLKYLEENEINLRDAICVGLTTHYGTLALAYFNKAHQEVEELSSNSIARLNAINQTALSLSLYGQVRQAEELSHLEKQVGLPEISSTVALLDSESDKEDKEQELDSCNNDTLNLDLD